MPWTLPAAHPNALAPLFPRPHHRPRVRKQRRALSPRSRTLGSSHVGSLQLRLLSCRRIAAAQQHERLVAPQNTCALRTSGSSRKND
eukprot:6043876-Amphidinium_carterae.4